MEILGIDDHRWLGFEEGCLADVDPEAGIEQVVALLDDVSPDTILTFGPDGMTFHPDHVAIHAWVTEAWKRRDQSPRLLLYAALEAEHGRRFGDRLEAWGVYMTDERPVPMNAADLLHATLTGWVLERKLAALAAMPSQVGSAMARISAWDFRVANSNESFVAA